MNISKVIKEKGFSVARVAESLGINRVSLSTMINGNPTYKTMKQVAEVIGANVGDFFEDERPSSSSSDFCGFMRYNGTHYTSDNLEDFCRMVEEVKTIAGNTGSR